MMDTEQLRSQLVGAWRLVSYETSSVEGGDTAYPLGPDASGLIIYTDDGGMSAQIMAAGRPAYTDEDVHGGTDEQRAAAAHGYLAYSGTYQVTDENVVEHHLEVSLFPNWVGTVVHRVAALEAKRLQLSLAEPLPVHGVLSNATLTWQRI
jgi:Lipocalin-like domain